MCHICNTKPVYEFTNKRKLCKNCFIKWFEKKALYTARKFNMLNKGDFVCYKKSSDFRDVVLENTLKMFAEKGRIKLTKGRKYDKFAIPVTINLTAYEFADKIINKSVKNMNEFLPKNKKIIKPLYFFLDEEVLLYVQLKKLKFKKIKEKKKDKISQFINELEKKHPEVKRAVVSSYLKLYC
ncbi:MAG: hypothetical protein ABH804_03115 [archaeon]